ncbi:dynein axonemal assembly factor 1 homolog [Episyrphus balteatus]|uniref:dynein axonemal assembly factor 1 homolog n=1 Tax=Episyrphus balteatus TaxID=286459 RepID=UPI0024862E53|nr:dynein axonemal assembly factor 1 homolog [Episyrphus balteatus]
MSNSEILGLHRITKKHLKELCKKHKLYQTPHLNDQLYLHFQGFQFIENLEEYTGLKCLWLESNAISEIQGLDFQTELKCLFLQNNLIKKIENLQCCTALDTLNLSSNHITKIENCGSDILPELSTLNLSRNYLRNSDGIRELVNCKNLWSLDLSHNRIDDILVVKIFANMPELRVLVLQGNPVVSKVPQYRKTLILECKNLTYLDSRPIFPKDRACAEAWKRGGYEEERKEHDRWNRMDRKKIRDSVNATLRLRQNLGAGDVQLLESSDEEDETKKLRKIPEQGDLEITGVIKNDSDSSESSSLTIFDDLCQEKIKQSNDTDTEKSNIIEMIENIEELEDKLTNEQCDLQSSSAEIVSNEESKNLEVNKTDIEESTLPEFEKDEKSSVEKKESNISQNEDISIQVSKENDESCLSLSNTDFLEGNETTKSFDSTSSESSSASSPESTSSSSESEFELTECDNKYGEEYITSNLIEDQELLQIQANNKNESSLDMPSLEGYESKKIHSFEEYKSTKVVELETEDLTIQEFEEIEVKDKLLHNKESSFEMEKNNISQSEDHEILQESIQVSEGNDSSFLSLSNTDFSEENEENETTKSLDSSSSSESSSTTSSDSTSSSCESEFEFTERDNKNFEEHIIANLKDNLQIQADNKSESAKDQTLIPVDKVQFFSTHNLSEENKSSDTSSNIESSGESSSDPASEFSFANNSSSNSENFSKANISGDISVGSNKAVTFLRGEGNIENVQDLNRNSKEECKTSSYEAEKHEDQTDFDIFKNSLVMEAFLSSSESTLLNSRPNVKEDIEDNEDYEHNPVEKTESDIFDEVDENSSINFKEDLENLDEYENQTETKPVDINSSEPLDDTEEKLRNIFAMIQSDENLNKTAESFEDQSKDQGLSDGKKLFSWPSLPNNHNTDIFPIRESNEDQFLRGRRIDSIWQDRDFEDTIASTWLESFLSTENKVEHLPSEEDHIEDLVDSESTMALYDSTEDTIASDWLEHYLCEHDSDRLLDEIIEEYDDYKALEESKNLIHDTNENSGHSQIIEEVILSDLQICTNKQVYENREDAKENLEEIETVDNFVESNENISSIQQAEDSNLQTFEADSVSERSVGKEIRINEISSNSTEESEEKLNDVQSSSWWATKLSAARNEVLRTPKVKSEDVEYVKEASSTNEEHQHFCKEEEQVSETLHFGEDVSNFLESLLVKTINCEKEGEPTFLNQSKEDVRKNSEEQGELASIMSEEKISIKIDKLESEDTISLSISESSLEPSNTSSTLREVITTFNEVVESIHSQKHKKSQLLQEFIANPLTKTFSAQTGDEINRQIDKLKDQKKEELLNLIDCVYAQREKYDDTLEVVNGRLMVVKRSTGALEELQPPPSSSSSSSQRPGSTKYINCGVSTTQISCCNEDHDDDDVDDCRTAVLSEDNDNDDDEDDEDDIEQHASDTKIKSILYSCSSEDVNCANESVSFSSLAGSSTQIEKEEEQGDNYHHSDDSDSQQSAKSEIDSEVSPKSCKWLGKEGTSSSVSIPAAAADYYNLSNNVVSEGGAHSTRSEFQVELADSIQSFMDFGEPATALEDIALIFENSKAEE